MIRHTAAERATLAAARKIKRQARAPAKPARAAQDATPRAGMTKARRERILAAHGHACAYPGCDEAKGLEIDHLIPLELGGSDGDENLQALCVSHHRQKTDLDVRMIAKARRLRKKAEQCREPSRLQSAGFPNQHVPMRRL
jgi:5-methylcytosine-specific restriction endonuclease McrA